MYTPAAFGMSDDEMFELMDSFPFATLCSVANEDMLVSHVPLVFKRETMSLHGHFAAANPHAKIADGANVLAIFHGPHSYISSGWYEERQSVPTWNYQVVHARGTIHFAEKAEQRDRDLAQLIHQHDPQLPLIDALNEPWVQAMAKGIRGFRISLVQLEGKSKMSQNRSREDQRRVIEKLRDSEREEGREIALRMRKNMEGSQASDEAEA
ncbi:FMN-binding negative transcriptional regulator [Ferroacidibacillus organovorans]|uniref:Transcriptional regulator n=1 Tax=Ferroacidibacillus organovorans TaxID=1765683 RepID=A0A101XRM1_9BACL|nr:FMN-binding negative transcriptional regulator [Ferroacidibacillus organovorans]KUO96278.1 hypothetical protein ATW55_03450 [Ferroacidibacillus organovorans]